MDGFDEDSEEAGSTPFLDVATKLRMNKKNPA
jgi:hypothetical protein